MKDIIKKLGGGDFRSIGRANEVVQDVLSDLTLFKPVFNALLSEDALVRMRAADVVEKTTKSFPELLKPHKHQLLNKVSRIPQQEVRWHVALMIPRLELNENDIALALEILFDYLKDKSKIVVASSMQALADLAKRNEELKPLAIERISVVMRKGSPAITARGKKLLVELNK